ncbi:MAG: hypothetical protein IT249_09485, partial [Chitinophagaceae bacterium]|nr:hypothetical protein [Chitinophagaceae bacterium]
YVDTQQQIVAVLLDYWNMDLNSYPANLKAIFSAYGVRAATNRQNALGGFLWDNTKGNLFDHIAWYMDETLPIDNKYLGTTHPADIKRLLLEVLRSSK